MNYNVLINYITLKNKNIHEILNDKYTLLDEGVLEKCKTLKLINIL